MATTDRAAVLHQPMCRDLLKEFKSLMPLITPEAMIEYFTVHGVIDASRLYEIVSSLRDKIPLKSIEGIDLADGSNCKIASYGPVNGQETAYGWRAKIDNCPGAIRIFFHHPLENKRYEGFIPFKEHKNIRYIVITDCKRGPKFGRWTKYIREVA